MECLAVIPLCVKMDSLEAYNEKKNRLILELKNSPDAVGLDKSSSNLFRSRNQKNTSKINVRYFNQVINIDAENLLAEVEGMTTYEGLVNETLKFDLMPAVVPELKSITIGGAASGVGIESSSFKYGLVHETIQEIDVLLSSGDVITCTKNNKFKDLFFAFPNSYGTFGYALKVKVKLVPVKKYVKLNHILYDNAKDYFKDLDKICGKKEYDFVDGTVFNENEMYITLGKFVDEAAFVSNYKYMGIYYKSIRNIKEDYLTMLDYIWRWDPDWFWCSSHFLVQNPIIRFIFGKFCLKSTFYWKLMSFSRKYKIAETISRVLPKTYSESIIQDVEIPIENCKGFVDFFHKNIDGKQNLY